MFIVKIIKVIKLVNLIIMIIIIKYYIVKVGTVIIKKISYLNKIKRKNIIHFINHSNKICLKILNKIPIYINLIKILED